MMRLLNRNRSLLMHALVLSALFLFPAESAESSHAFPVCTLAVGCEPYQSGSRGCRRAVTHDLSHVCGGSNVRAVYNQTGTNSGTVTVYYGSSGWDVSGEVEIYHKNGNRIDERFCFGGCSGKSYTYGPYTNVGGVRASQLVSAGLSHWESQVNLGIHNDPCFGVSCSDGNACTVDYCSGGACYHDPRDCDDGNACTLDSCNPSTGCQSGPPDCNDFNNCTADICDPQLGCINWPNLCLAEGSQCGTGFCDPSTGNCLPNLSCFGAGTNCLNSNCDNGVCSEIPIGGTCRCISQ